VSVPDPAAFYCVSDARYFLGAVGMLNSLRLLGHREPVYVLDCGLTDLQRELLSPHATLVPAPDEAPPWLLKTVAPLRHPAEVMVLIDADIVVTRPLTDLLEQSRQGKVVAFENRSNRFVPEWGDLLGLGTASPRQYVSSSLVCLSGTLGSEILQLMADLRDRIDFDHTFWRDNIPDYPFLFADQDILNAILASRVDPGQVVEVEGRLEGVMPFTGLRVVDIKALRCAYEDGAEPYAIHHFLPSKPWLEPMTPGVYSRLLVRLLRGGEIAVRVPPRELPRHLRPGLLAAARRWYREPLSASIRLVRDRIRSNSGTYGA
jgi:hypothetical protein